MAAFCWFLDGVEATQAQLSQLPPEALGAGAQQATKPVVTPVERK